MPCRSLLHQSTIYNSKLSVVHYACWAITMHFWRISGRSFARSATATIPKGAQLALLFCSLGIAALLLVAGGTTANPNVSDSNSNEPSGSQVHRKTLQGMVWIPGGTFLMGTNDRESFPNERPAHFVQVQGFWMDKHDVLTRSSPSLLKRPGM